MKSERLVSNNFNVQSMDESLQPEVVQGVEEWLSTASAKGKVQFDN